jgi:multimeric flavodoxin WrbA
MGTSLPIPRRRDGPSQRADRAEESFRAVLVECLEERAERPFRTAQVGFSAAGETGIPPSRMPSMPPRDAPPPSSGQGSRGARKSLVDSCSRLIRHLEKSDSVLLLTTSTRYRGEAWDVPKSTQLARRVREHLKEKKRRVTLLDVPALRIHTCEGNVSSGKGNRCGLLEAKLPDRSKNPTGHHRCWASINNDDDELYVVSRELFRSRAVVFFVSVRWGQTNSVYQRLWERLTWIENRITTLGEEPIPQLKGLEAGIVVFGQNWNDAQVLKTQRQNYEWFGWKTPEALSFYWQYTRDSEDESPESYLRAIEEFQALLRAEFRRDRD